MNMIEQKVDADVVYSILEDMTKLDVSYDFMMTYEENCYGILTKKITEDETRWKRIGSCDKYVKVPEINGLGFGVSSVCIVRMQILDILNKFRESEREKFCQSYMRRIPKPMYTNKE